MHLCTLQSEKKIEPEKPEDSFDLLISVRERKGIGPKEVDKAQCVKLAMVAIAIAALFSLVSFVSYFQLDEQTSVASG